MSSYKKYSSLVLSLLLAFTLTSFSQSQIELSVQCLLSDAGEKITNEQFELNVKLNYTGENENLWQYSETRTTDESGWFNFSIPAISQYLDLEGNAQKPLIITMRFLPTSYTKWDITGGEFEVSYIITPGQKDKPEEMKILRDDSADLTAHDQFFAFKDNYPYAYISSGFLFTDTPPLAQSTVNDLRQWIAPLTDDPDSRGVKGGFPKGGYRKK